MSYRKFKADYLFDGFKMHEVGSVLVCREDGGVESILSADQAGGGLENFSGMIVPGFINSHCHLELSHLKGLIPEKEGLVNFVLSVIKQRNQREELTQGSIQRAEDSMLKEGIVAVGDICNTDDTLEVKSHGRISYYNFIELLGWNPEQSIVRYQIGKQLAALFLEKGTDNMHVSLTPHAPYSVSDQLWKLMEPDFNGKTISIHNQESAAENDFFISGRGGLEVMYAGMKINNNHFQPPGIRSLPHYLNKLKGAAKIMLVHNTYTNANDINLALNFTDQLFFCLCPNANQYIEGRLPDIPLFLKSGARMVLGTDSLASNHQLSILDEMKTIKEHYPSISTEEMLVWATSNGAMVLNFDNELGDFKKGKKPGVVLIKNLIGGEISAGSTSLRII